MFEKYLITAKQLARYNNAPLAEERLRYMNHVEQEGRGHNHLRRGELAWTNFNCRIAGVVEK
jgi:hypothetical protein